MNTQKRAKPKRLLSLLLTVVMLLGVLPLSAVSVSAEGTVTGSGTDANPYVVTDYDGLRDVLMNRGSSQTTYLKLGADFDTKGKADGAGVTEATKIIIRQTFVLDLNGHKAELYSLKINHLIRIIHGGLTVWDTSPGQTGELQGSGDVDYFILLDYGKFTLSSGTVSANLINYRWRSVIRTTKTGQAKVTVNGGALNIETKGRFCSTENGHGFEQQDYVLYIDEGDSAEINGGTFNGRVLFCGKTVAPSDTTKKLIVNGGNFKRSIFFDIKDGEEGATVTPAEINGGVFEYDVEDGTRRDPSHYDTIYHMQFEGMKGRAVFKPGTVIYAQGNSRSEGDEWYAVDDSNAADVSTKLLHEQGGSVFLGKDYCYKSPITVIPNAYGIKDVTLNGTSIQYTHNSPYAPGYDVRRSETNTLTFSWYDLPEEMKSAGYSYSYSYRLYRNNVETVTGGTVTPTTADGVSTWTHTVPADSAMNSYVVYLRLDLMKDGALVNTAGHDEYIVRLSGTDNIVSIAETALNLPGGDLRPDIYYGKPRESNTASVSGGMKYTVSSQTNWAGTLADDYHFKAGNEYTKTVVLRANAGYQFTASCAAALTGAPSARITRATVSTDKKTLTVQIQATCVTVLRTASGTLTGFYQGMDVWDARVVSAEPEKYDIEIVYIGDKSYGSNNMSEPNWFGKDCNYAFGLKVVPKPGYGFLETGYGTVNLTVKMDDRYGDDIKTVTTEYTTWRQVGSMSYSGKLFETVEDCWAPPQTFDRVNISIKAPVAGDSADDIAYKKAFVDQTGFTVTDFYWKKKGGSGRFTGTFQSGETYTYNITVECPWYMEPVKNSYGNANDSVYVNGADAYRYHDETTSPGKLLIVAIDDMTATGTAPSPGYTVYGAATSFGDADADVLIQLIESGASEASYEKTVKGNSASYSIDGVLPGTYTMKVMKQNHVTREYSITVGTENLKQDVKIHLLGDINGDGKVNVKDWNTVNAHVNETKLLTGYELKCAEVTGDNKVNVKDGNRIYEHVNETNPLW